MKHNCPHCGHENEGNAGDLIRCESCQKVFEVGGENTKFLAVTAAAEAAPKQTVEAITKPCPYCAEAIKVEAVKCKHCGEMLGEQPIVAPPSEPAEKEQKVSIFGVIVLVLFLLWGVGKCTGNDKSQSDAAEPVDKVAALFSGWDGSNREMVRAAKAQMKAPDSFDHVETRYSNRGDKVVITMTFRGKNSFNATVTSKAMGFIDPDTRVLTGFTIYQ